MTLLEFLLKLIGNDQESRDLQQDFRDDPHGTLRDAGLEDLTAEDVHDALVLIQDNDTASFDRNYDTGSNHLVAAAAAPHHGGGHHEGDHDGHKGAVDYINRYVTNNYVDDRDTVVDNSVNQHIDTDGGDFRQTIDTDVVTASGDGAVAAGGDIEDSTITTGNGNIVGDGNDVVRGDGNTTAFGNGSATSTNVGGDVTVDDGSAFATGGSASVDNSDNSVNGSFNEETDNSVNDSFNDESDNSVDDSFNTHQDVDNSNDGSFNTSTDNSQNGSGNFTVDTGDIDVDDSVVAL
ncbi:IniB N-terminal domain-containing protein [Pseudonocardia sp. RS11V-5]|uniref:IniB N-terminal domain-containing protein n=1 Tax=Pseudonocardia terrae TaxID=2905831 RepID=UPI001E3044C8|nr:IniB N-terminal domain-containing protein [Pseudonocardia terrae]MCE3555187.1 IniB N-terminal domain-containing protein [Pseudonocardia terrae]